MNNRFTTLYHLFKLYDAVKQIKFSGAHLAADLPMAQKSALGLSAQALDRAMGNIDVAYLEELIEETVELVMKQPNPED